MCYPSHCDVEMFLQQVLDNFINEIISKNNDLSSFIQFVHSGLNSRMSLNKQPFSVF